MWNTFLCRDLTVFPTGMLYNQSEYSTLCLCLSTENARRHLPHRSKSRYLIWNKSRLARAAGKDTPLFINRGCLTKMCCRESEAEQECACVCVCASYGLVGVGSWSPARKAESWGFTFHSGCLLLSLEINEPRVEVFFFFKILFVY